jgi:DNA-binding YbaB/EbfC family protein
MAGVGKLLKQAAKMQKKLEALQAEMAEKEIEVASGGGAVKIVITASGEFRSIKIEEDLLKEEASLVEETILGAVKEAATTAKTLNDDEMGKATEGMSIPGLM